MASGNFVFVLTCALIVLMIAASSTGQQQQKQSSPYARRGAAAREQAVRRASQKPSRVAVRQHQQQQEPAEDVAEDVEDDDGTTDQCPDPDGYFADAEQCDKYYECIGGSITEKLCPDGMVFNDYDPQVEKCDLPFNIDCSTRQKLQEPRPTFHCRRLNGYFQHEDPAICDKFYYCVDGKFNAVTCPAGLVYNERTGICTWPDEAGKKGCGSKDVFDFTCPHVDDAEAGKHPRYPDPEECQYFYVCINGQIPRRSGCKLGQVFDARTNQCEWARKVPKCKDWYKGRLTDAELDALENPPVITAVKSGSSKSSGSGSGASGGGGYKPSAGAGTGTSGGSQTSTYNRRKQARRPSRTTTTTTRKPKTTTTTTTETPKSAADEEELVEYEYEDVEE